MGRALGFAAGRSCDYHMKMIFNFNVLPGSPGRAGKSLERTIREMKRFVIKGVCVSMLWRWPAACLTRLKSR